MSAKSYIETHPDRVPTIVEVHPSSKITLKKNKFLVPKEFTLSMFLQVLKKHINIRSEEALFIYIDGQLPPCSATMNELYTQHHSKEDDMLHILVTKENTYG
jgi:GABA(A) receptor-associated protein